MILGAAETGPVINRVEDLYTGTENSVLTPGRNLRIYGQRLRIAGDDPAAVGVWFVAVGETPERIRLDDRDLVDNDPSKLTLVVPSLAPGGYFVEIVTQSTTVFYRMDNSHFHTGITSISASSVLITFSSS